MGLWIPKYLHAASVSPSISGKMIDSLIYSCSEAQGKGAPYEGVGSKSYVRASKNLVSFCKVVEFPDVRLSVERYAPLHFDLGDFVW